jgi:hypothetical protein
MLTVLHESEQGIYFHCNGQYIHQPRSGTGRVLTMEQAWQDLFKMNPTADRLAELAAVFAETRQNLIFS